MPEATESWRLWLEDEAKNGPVPLWARSALKSHDDLWHEVARLRADLQKAAEDLAKGAMEIERLKALPETAPFETAEELSAELKRCRQGLAEAGIMLNYSPPEINEAKRLIRAALAGEKREEV